MVHYWPLTTVTTYQVLGEWVTTTVQHSTTHEHCQACGHTSTTTFPPMVNDTTYWKVQP